MTLSLSVNNLIRKLKPHVAELNSQHSQLTVLQEWVFIGDWVNQNSGASKSPQFALTNDAISVARYSWHASQNAVAAAAFVMGP